MLKFGLRNSYFSQKKISLTQLIFHKVAFDVRLEIVTRFEI